MSHPEVRQEVEPCEVWVCEARCGAVVLGAGERRGEDLRRGSVSGGRWGCGAIAWSGGGAVRGNVTGWSCVLAGWCCVLAGWCVAVAPCRVPGDG